MYIVRPDAGSPIAFFNEEGDLIGTIKLIPNPSGRGRIGIGLDFPKSIKIQTDYVPHQIRTVMQPSTFGDFDPDEYEVPAEAGNGFDYE